MNAKRRPAGAPPRPGPEIHSLRDVIERVTRVAQRDRVQMRDLIEAFGATSFLPLLLVPALAVITPLSGIPLFSSLCGITIALVALQMVLRRDHVWLPGFVMNRSVAGARLIGALRRIDGLVTWIDGHSRDRLAWVVRQPFVTLPQVLVVLSGAAMPFLELMPFSSSLLGTAVVLFSVGFLAHDGLFALLGAGFVGIAAMIPLLLVT